MSKLDILIIPDRHLRQVCEPVTKVDGEARRLLDDMLETMYAAPGIGLAAPQVGVMRRMLVIDVSREGEPKQPHCFINPKLVWASEQLATYQEGCLSIPDYYEDVERPARVRVEYLDRDGAEQEIVAEGLLATCLQHEIDHLDGVLFIDYISRLKRERVMKKFIKRSKNVA
ncbi:MAG: peptide deformylase [Ancalomicrobiaceae bacterium]|nr:peptide deformylase [Ancalomicrobiaceae bacterium]